MDGKIFKMAYFPLKYYLFEFFYVVWLFNILESTKNKLSALSNF